MDFLQGNPKPVGTEQGTAARRLSPSTVSSLMEIEGVDGVWVDELSQQPKVVIYVTDRKALTKTPAVVEGLPVRIELGDPIRAL